MATTPLRNVRIADTDWTRLDEVAKANRTTRSALITQLIHQYLSGVITSPLLPQVPQEQTPTE